MSSRIMAPCGLVVFFRILLVYADGVTEGENAEEKVLVGHIM